LRLITLSPCHSEKKAKAECGTWDEAGYGHRGAAVEYTFLPCMLYAERNLTRSSHGRFVPPSMSESIPSRTVGPSGRDLSSVFSIVVIFIVIILKKLFNKNYF
jgi:hypothetical protein